MADDEPTAWELQRSIRKIGDDLRDDFTEVNKRLDRLLTTEVHLSDLRRIDDRLAALNEDINAETTTRAAQLAFEQNERQKAVSDEQSAREKGDQENKSLLQRMVVTQRWIATGLILPIALFIATLILARP